MGVLGAVSKGLRGWSKTGHFRAFGGWPLGGVFSATKYVPLIPWGYLERDFRPFKAKVCPSDSASRNRVVPRNFTVGSGSNVCNNFPMGDRPPYTPLVVTVNRYDLPRRYSPLIP